LCHFIIQKWTKLWKFQDEPEKFLHRFIRSLKMNLYKKHRKHVFMGILASVMLILLFSIAYANPVAVDTFDSTTMVVSTSAGAPIDFLAATGPDIVGVGNVPPGERDIELIQTGGPFGASVNVAGGFLGLSVDALTFADANIQWDGPDNSPILNPAGLGGIDFTDSGSNDGMEISIIYSDGGFDFTLRLFTDATHGSEYTYNNLSPVAPADNTSIFFPFSEFTTISGMAGPVDPQNIGAVEFFISPTRSSVDLIIDIIQANSVTDWGDLPAAYNATDITDNGARHIARSIKLGDDLDTEANGFESPNADGDDNDNRDDEDGIIILPGNWGDGSADIQYTVNGDGTTDACLLGWIDWNWDNVFNAAASGSNNARELVINTAVPVADMGTQQTATIISPNISGGYVYPTPADGTNPDNLFARFRLFRAGDQLFVDSGLTLDGNGCPTGSISVISAALIFGEGEDGEVEDRRIEFSDPTAVNLQTFSADNATTLPVVGIAIVAVLALVSAGIFIVRREQKQA